MIQTCIAALAAWMDKNSWQASWGILAIGIFFLLRTLGIEVEVSIP